MKIFCQIFFIIILSPQLYSQRSFTYGVKLGVDKVDATNDKNTFGVSLNNIYPIKGGVFVRKQFERFNLQLGFNYARYNKETLYNVKYKDITNNKFSTIIVNDFYESEVVFNLDNGRNKFVPFIGIGLNLINSPGYYSEFLYQSQSENTVLFTEKIESGDRFKYNVTAGLRYKLILKNLVFEPSFNIGYSINDRQNHTIIFKDGTLSSLEYNNLYTSLSLNIVLK